MPVAVVLKAVMREAEVTVAWRVDMVAVREVVVMEVDTEAVMAEVAMAAAMEAVERAAAVTVVVTVEAVTVEEVMALQTTWIQVRGELRPRR